MSEQNKQVVAAIEAAWNGNRLDELDGHFAAGFVTHAQAPGLPPGLEGAKLAHQFSMKAMPDRKVEVLDLIGEGDRVLVRTRMTGTNTGGFEWLHVGPNGRAVDVESWAIYRLQDGQVAEAWGINDVFALAMQLGAMEHAPA
jgi:predicted ester cyclase